MIQTSKIGKRGTVVIPAPIRERLKLTEGSLIVVEEQPEGLLIRPAVAWPIEIYTPDRKAEFLLTNAVSTKDYREARLVVQKMGLDPDRIKHLPPNDQP